MIRVVTAFDEASRDELARLKRKKWGPRQFVISGEWSQSPFHQGKTAFDVRATADRRAWALIEIAFPTRIVAVVEADRELTLEEAAGETMWAVEEKGGPYVDGIHDYGDLDSGELWRFYDAARADGRLLPGRDDPPPRH